MSTPSLLSTPALDALAHGAVIPAHPLALHVDGSFDERRQRALTRYYLASGAGGVAVAVHTTQFEIREPEVGLFRPVLELAAETIDAEAVAVRQGSRCLRIHGAGRRRGRDRRRARL